jgi:hypothetical protein
MKRAWPPYQLVEDSVVATAERRLEKLERLYHIGQDKAWDGKQILAELIARHGPPRLDPQKREAALQLLSILLWGELAAWAISADLAERIEDVEAKMAATSQAHDEARHFYVLRDYLRALGEPVPRLGGVGRSLLVSILETKSLTKKLIGMQLLVESNALALFRGLVEANVEPVLAELLPYYERDEARHVGLGVLYLPRLLAAQTPLEAAGTFTFQLRCVGMLITAGMGLRPHLRALGMEPRALAERTVKLQDQIVRDMRDHLGGVGRLHGIANPSKGFGPRLLEFVHPKAGEANAPAWQRAALRAWTRVGAVADRALA